MKVIAYCGMSIAKTGVFTDIFTYCNLRKLNASISNQISIIVISVDNSGVAGGKQRWRFASNNNC